MDLRKLSFWVVFSLGLSWTSLNFLLKPQLRPPKQLSEYSPKLNLSQNSSNPLSMLSMSSKKSIQFYVFQKKVLRETSFCLLNSQMISRIELCETKPNQTCKHNHTIEGHLREGGRVFNYRKGNVRPGIPRGTDLWATLREKGLL